MGMARKKRPTPVPPEPIVPLFDSHTHLWSTVLKNQHRQDVVGSDAGDRTFGEEDHRRLVGEFMDRAYAVGVRGVCTVGDGIEETEKALQAAEFHDRVWAACAVHPTKAQTVTGEVCKRLREMAFHPRCVAIGETGLDAYWIGKDPGDGEETPSIEVQEEALRFHIDLACESGKALMIHNREADADLLRVLADAPQPENVILHCFSSPLDVAKESLDRGYVLSFAGNVTFKRNEELREAARIAPAEQILVETDAPYMTPEPFRGARNEPAFVGYTAACVAEQRGMAPQELGELITANAQRLYGIDLGA